MPFMNTHERLVEVIGSAQEDLPVDLVTFVQCFAYYYQQSFVREENAKTQLIELTEVLTDWVRRQDADVLSEDQIQESAYAFLDMLACVTDYHLKGTPIPQAMELVLERFQIEAVGPIQTLYRAATNYTPKETMSYFGNFQSWLN